MRRLQSLRKKDFPAWILRAQSGTGKVGTGCEHSQKCKVSRLRPPPQSAPTVFCHFPSAERSLLSSLLSARQACEGDQEV